MINGVLNELWRSSGLSICDKNVTLVANTEDTYVITVVVLYAKQMILILNVTRYNYSAWNQCSYSIARQLGTNQQCANFQGVLTFHGGSYQSAYVLKGYFGNLYMCAWVMQVSLFSSVHLNRFHCIQNVSYVHSYVYKC